MATFRNSFPGVRLIQVGAYLYPEYASFFLGSPGREIAGRVVGLDCFWKEAGRVEAELAECETDLLRVAIVEQALIRRLKPHAFPIAARAARLGRDCCESTTVGSMAESIGVSRQFLGRVFREQIGLSPKLYLRLCRFRAALASQASGTAGDSYFDQSHMIAEFREFSGMTPAAILRKRPFHPFAAR